MKKSPSHLGPGFRPRVDRDLVDKMAVKALGFLAADTDRLGRFFDMTGLTVQTLRQAAGTPGFDSSLLDYLGSDEALLRAFADQNGYDPAEVDAVRMALSGQNDEWEG